MTQLNIQAATSMCHDVRFQQKKGCHGELSNMIHKTMGNTKFIQYQRRGLFTHILGLPEDICSAYQIDVKALGLGQRFRWRTLFLN